MIHKKAFDELDVDEVLKHYGYKGGIGIYPIKTGVRNCAFVHVDVRAAKGRWKG